MILPLSEVGVRIVPILLDKIFIYPTDTIYGIGCDAEKKELVKKIKKIKKRKQKSFSIIVPSKEYILRNFVITKKGIDKYLPGPYTLILKKKNPEFLKHVSGNRFIGVRIPAHPLTKILQKTGKPIVSTSVNISGEKPAKKIKEINRDILKEVELVIDGGNLPGKPSVLIKKERAIER